MCSVMADSLQPHGLQPTRFFCPWNFPGKNTGVCCTHNYLGFDNHFNSIPTHGEVDTTSEQYQLQARSRCPKSVYSGTSLAAQWLGIHVSNAEGMGLIPDQETKIPYAPQCGQNIFFLSVCSTDEQSELYPPSNSTLMDHNFSQKQSDALISTVASLSACDQLLLFVLKQ